MSSIFSTTRPVILASTKISSVRYTAISKQKRIPVQLLRNIEGLGIRGEIVEVKPTHMINWLQFQNRACFILPGKGPRIPVVDRTKEFKRLEEEKRKITILNKERKLAEEQEAKTVKLEDLSKITGLNFTPKKKEA